jgi:hypothetical protein
MGHLTRRHLGIWTACAALALPLVAAAALAQNTPPQRWPPQFPREGATKLFENDRIIVWEQVGRPKEPFVHRHLRDTIVVALQGGRIETRTADGVRNDGKAEAAATTRIHPGKDGVGAVLYTTAGLGPHAEVATDPDNTPVSIFIELKGTEPKDCGQWSTACP